eukprot:TRINITY_DN494_c0_g2_i1.p1 TRINITY_DN494_c0_g2~~TRINITY_DN494_c0_g2_i1.p1  ORF type:complete len:757 (+),score=122.81 TRINITY_DN494_c0_g2_i1:20-2290(+)
MNPELARHIWKPPSFKEIERKQLTTLVSAVYDSLQTLLLDSPETVVTAVERQPPGTISAPQFKRALALLHEFLISCEGLKERRNGSFGTPLEELGLFRNYSFVQLPRIEAYLRNRVTALPERFVICPYDSQPAAMLRLYTTEIIHARINTALRGRDLNQLVDWRDSIFLIDQALRAIPPTNGTFYRGVRALEEDGKYVTDAELCFSTVVSASALRDVAIGFAFSGWTTGQPLPYLFVLQCTEARPTSLFSVYPGEAEVSFPPLSRWRVVEIQHHEDGYIEVVLSQLPSGSLFCDCPPARFPEAITRVSPQTFLPLDASTVLDSELQTALSQLRGPAAEYYAAAVAHDPTERKWAVLKQAHATAVALAGLVPDDLHAEVDQLSVKYGYWTVLAALSRRDEAVLSSWSTSPELIGALQDRALEKRLQDHFNIPLCGLVVQNSSLARIWRVITDCRELNTLHQAFVPSAEPVVRRLATPLLTVTPIPKVTYVFRGFDLLLAATICAYNIKTEFRAYTKKSITWSQFKRNVLFGVASLSAATTGSIVGTGSMAAVVTALSASTVPSFCLGALGAVVGAELVNRAAKDRLRALVECLWKPTDYPEEEFNELRMVIKDATEYLHLHRSDLGVFESEGKFEKMKKNCHAEIVALHGDHMANDDSRTDEERRNNVETLTLLLARRNILKKYRAHLAAAFSEVGLQPPRSYQEARPDVIVPLIKAFQPKGSSQKSSKEVLLLHYNWVDPVRLPCVALAPERICQN